MSSTVRALARRLATVESVRRTAPHGYAARLPAPSGETMRAIISHLIEAGALDWPADAQPDTCPPQWRGLRQMIWESQGDRAPASHEEETSNA